MTNLINGFFALELGLLLTHEMDAIRHKEWEMFIFLKDRSARLHPPAPGC